MFDASLWVSHPDFTSETLYLDQHLWVLFSLFCSFNGKCKVEGKEKEIREQVTGRHAYIHEKRLCRGCLEKNKSLLYAHSLGVTYRVEVRESPTFSLILAIPGLNRCLLQVCGRGKVMPEGCCGWQGSWSMRRRKNMSLEQSF